MSGLVDDQAYEVLSIRATEPPPDADGADWHCYVISQGDNTIRGYRQGSLKSVTRSVEEIVLQLNERRMGRRGRVHLYTTGRGNPANKKQDA